MYICTIHACRYTLYMFKKHFSLYMLHISVISYRIIMEGYNARQMNLSCPSPNLELFPFPVMVAGSTPPNPFPPPSVVVATLVVVIAPPNLSPLLDVEASPIDGRPEVVLLSGLFIVDRPPMGLISERPLLPPTCTFVHVVHCTTCIHIHVHVCTKKVQCI